MKTKQMSKNYLQPDGRLIITALQEDRVQAAVDLIKSGMRMNGALRKIKDQFGVGFDTCLMRDIGSGLRQFGDQLKIVVTHPGKNNYPMLKNGEAKKDIVKDVTIGEKETIGELVKRLVPNAQLSLFLRLGAYLVKEHSVEFHFTKSGSYMEPEKE